jgi:hypothetical protein
MKGAIVMFRYNVRGENIEVTEAIRIKCVSSKRNKDIIFGTIKYFLFLIPISFAFIIKFDIIDIRRGI